MGKQDNVVLLTGTVGNLAFYKSKRGYEARIKRGVSGDRIKNDPAFARTRENGLEFGRAGKGSRLLRTAFRSYLVNLADSNRSSRLTRDMLKVIQADPDNARGQRLIKGDKVGMLEGFEFNESSRLTSTLYVLWQTTFDRLAGTAAITLPSFVPQVMIAPPQGATHARIFAAAAEIDFAENRYTFNEQESALFQINEQPLPITELNVTFTPDSAKPVFLVLGIAFFQEVNGSHYPLKNGAYNAVSLVKVDGGA